MFHPPVLPIRVLCADEDVYLMDLLRYALGHDGFAVEVANTGADAWRSVQADPPDVVVLGADLPDMSGFTLCHQLSKNAHVPVVLLTANGLDADMVAGFEQGADDCVAKPFSIQVLSYRIRAVLRRTSAELSTSPARTHYPLGSGSFDAGVYQVTGPRGSVKLTPIQGKILRLLLENEGRVLSAEQLMSKVWPFEAESDVAVVKTHISNLRKKLADALGGADLLRTVPGVGYSLRPPPEAFGQPVPNAGMLVQCGA